MERKDFLKSLGLAGAVAAFPMASSFANKKDDNENKDGSCTLIPIETSGPFPLDLTENTNFFRENIVEGKIGVPLNLTLRIIGNSNCEPIQNLRVNIWHCDKDGLYSGYSQTNNPGQAGLTYLRGYQFTDSSGEANFTTIFPGWYNGRICHIHFQVYVSSNYAAISQLTFDVDQKQAIYTDNPTIYTNGVDPMSISSDNIFSDGYIYQIVDLTENSTTGGYNAVLEVTIQGSGTTTGIGNLEKENAKQFALGQNFPNPFSEITTIPLALINASKVSIDLYDLQGRKVASVMSDDLSSGNHLIDVNLQELGLEHANYMYQLEVSNTEGIYRDCKMMTALR